MAELGLFPEPFACMAVCALAFKAGSEIDPPGDGRWPRKGEIFCVEV
jgi:hypothetical protein